MYGHLGKSQKIKDMSEKPIKIEVFTAAIMRSSVFWDMMMHSPLKVNRCFKRTCRLHLQGQRERRARNQLSLLPTSASFLLSLLFNLGDGGDTFL
jgi:hypothetical protein